MMLPKATIELLIHCNNHVHPITADNGREFSGHKAIDKELEGNVYSPHPYISWVHGTNENTFSFLKQFFN